MSKVIPAALVTHKALQTSTLVRLLKLKCKDGTLFGFANYDQDVTFDDSSGDGAIVYRSGTGLIPTKLAAAAGTSVDNTNVRGVVADLEALGVTEAQVRSGKLDYADGWVYEVNVGDLTAGRREIKAHGKLAACSMYGEEFDNEFFTLTQHYKQGLGLVTSVTCRSKFGSKPVGTGGEQPEVRRAPCGKDWVWTAFTITSVDPSEPDRIVTASALAGATDFYTPGVMRMTTGQNTGLQREVEVFTSGGIIALSLPADFDFAPGDEGEIRQDCSKVHDDADHGCEYHYGADWVLHFDGEPHLPLGEEGVLTTPGAALP